MPHAPKINPANNADGEKFMCGDPGASATGSRTPRVGPEFGDCGDDRVHVLARSEKQRVAQPDGLFPAGAKGVGTAPCGARGVPSEAAEERILEVEVRVPAAGRN